MTTCLSCPSTRRLARAVRLCAGLWLLAVHLPAPVLGQSDYATPYTFITLAGNAGFNGNVDATGGGAKFNFPTGVAVDRAGNIYVSDCFNYTIRKVSPTGVVTTLAGLAGNPGSADGTGSAARFGTPFGLALDGATNVYVVDHANFTIRKVTPAGVVTTVAGMAGSQGTNNGTGSAARFYGPHGIAVDSATNLYVTDVYSIRKVTPAGVVTTLAGREGTFGTNDGTGNAALFYFPFGVGLDSSNNLFVADDGNNTIRKVTLAGVVTTLAGQPGVSGDADGTNDAAQFYGPVGLTVDSAGFVYVGDEGNSTIRKVTPEGVVTTLGGLAGDNDSADGAGSDALFNFPFGVALDSSGSVYVADYANSTIRKGYATNSIAPPVLHLPKMRTGQFSFGVTGFPGLVLDIESSADLSSWQTLGTYILAGGTNYFVDTNQPQAFQFYRANVH